MHQKYTWCITNDTYISSHSFPSILLTGSGHLLDVPLNVRGYWIKHQPRNCQSIFQINALLRYKRWDLLTSSSKLTLGPWPLAVCFRPFVLFKAVQILRCQWWLVRFSVRRVTSNLADNPAGVQRQLIRRLKVTTPCQGQTQNGFLLKNKIDILFVFVLSCT